MATGLSRVIPLLYITCKARDQGFITSVYPLNFLVGVRRQLSGGEWEGSQGSEARNRQVRNVSNEVEEVQEEGKALWRSIEPERYCRKINLLGIGWRVRGVGEGRNSCGIELKSGRPSESM